MHLYVHIIQKRFPRMIFKIYVHAELEKIDFHISQTVFFWQDISILFSSISNLMLRENECVAKLS